MKKLHFYGIEDRGREGRFLYKFPFLKDLQTWIDEQPSAFARYQEYAIDPIVRRINRRLAAGEIVIFPVAITP